MKFGSLFGAVGAVVGGGLGLTVDILVLQNLVCNTETEVTC